MIEEVEYILLHNPAMSSTLAIHFFYLNDENESTPLLFLRETTSTRSLSSIGIPPVRRTDNASDDDAEELARAAAGVYDEVLLVNLCTVDDCAEVCRVLRRAGDELRPPLLLLLSTGARLRCCSS